MPDRSIIKDRAHNVALTSVDIVLIALYQLNAPECSPSQIQNEALDLGFTKASSLNIGRELAKAKGLALRTSGGWELTTTGKRDVEAKLQIESSGAAPKKQASSLRGHVDKMSNTQTRDFLDEAIRCLEAELLRSAVVLSWVGALSVLQDTVVNKRLTDFNQEAKRRDPKWRTAKNADDLNLMKEFSFLQVLESISVIGKNVKQELENCLKLRNACGHRNSLKVGDSKVSAHVEALIQNVFEPFS